MKLLTHRARYEGGEGEYAEGFKAGLKRLHDGARCGWRVVVGGIDDVCE